MGPNPHMYPLIAASFLIEMLASPEERAFLNAVRENPTDKGIRGQYADWLKERGREYAAKLLLDGYCPLV